MAVKIYYDKIVDIEITWACKKRYVCFIHAIEYSIGRGARIINCSWSFTEYSEELYNIIKNNPDVLFVCAAGKEGIDLAENERYPCSYKLDNMISVGAIDNCGNIADTSGYGKCVNVLAPGLAIKTIFPEDDEDYIDGTSEAAAFVTAEAALILSVNDTLSPVQIKEIICH